MSGKQANYHRKRATSYDNTYIQVKIEEPALQLGDNAETFTLDIKTEQPMRVECPSADGTRQSLETVMVKLTICGPMEWNGLLEALRLVTGDVEDDVIEAEAFGHYMFNREEYTEGD